MEYTIKNRDEVVVIDIIGELDLYNTPELITPVMNIINSEKRPLIFNLEKLEYIDSSGIGAFVQFFTQLKKKKRTFCFTNIQGNVERILRLTSLNNLLPIESTMQEAIDAVKEQNK
jgi:anti-sigma B factor antagonist